MEVARIGTYVDTMETIKKLSGYKVTPKKYLELLNQLRDLSKLLDPTSAPINSRGDGWEDAGFYPFKNICLLSQDFRQLADKIDLAVDSADASDISKQHIVKDLRSLIKSFKQKFNEEIREFPIYLVSPEKNELHYYHYQDGWIKKGQDAKIFSVLPKITKSCLQDGAHCLAYGMPQAALSLSHQAVESMLRYCLRRFDPNSAERTWGPMAEKLNKYFTKTENPAAKLEDLKVMIRNTLAHGRQANFDITCEKGREYFDMAWSAIRQIYLSLDRKSEQSQKLQVRLKINTMPTFKTVLAAYLYYQNDELPGISINSPDERHVLSFGDEIPVDAIQDQTILTFDEAIIRNKPNNEYPDQIEKLFIFAKERNEEYSPGIKRGDKSTFDLMDLFLGIRAKGNHRIDILQATWDMFDKFCLDRTLNPKNGSELISDCQQEDVYQYICDNLPS